MELLIPIRQPMQAVLRRSFYSLTSFFHFFSCFIPLPTLSYPNILFLEMGYALLLLDNGVSRNPRTLSYPNFDSDFDSVAFYSGTTRCRDGRNLSRPSIAYILHSWIHNPLIHSCVIKIYQFK